MNDTSAILNLKLNSDTGSGRLAGARADFSLNLKATGSDAFEASLEKARSQEKQRSDASQQRVGVNAEPGGGTAVARTENPAARAHIPKPEDRHSTVARAAVADRSAPGNRSNSTPAAATEAENPPSGTTVHGKGDNASESKVAPEETTSDDGANIAADGEAYGVTDTDGAGVDNTVADTSAAAGIDADMGGIDADINMDAVPVPEPQDIPAMLGLPAEQVAQAAVHGMQNEASTQFEGELPDLSAENIVAGVATRGIDGEIPTTAGSALPDSGMVGTETGAVIADPSAAAEGELTLPLPDSGIVGAIAGAVAGAAAPSAAGVAEAVSSDSGKVGVVAGAVVADTTTPGLVPPLMEVAGSTEELLTDLPSPALSESVLSEAGLSSHGEASDKSGEGLLSTEAAIRAGAGVQKGAGDSGLLKASLKGLTGTEGKGGMAEDALKTAESLTGRLTTPATPATVFAPAGGAQAVGAAVGHSSWQSLPGNLLGPGGAFAAMQAQVGSPAFGEELAQKMSLFVSKSLHSAQLVLNPAELGPIEIKLQLHKDQAQIQVQSSVPLVRELVEGSAQRLREMLAEQGINLTRFDVGSRHSDRGDAHSGQQQDGERRNGGGFGADEQGSADKAQILGLISERLVDYYA
jgi:flagellar hook-length control protein FliK